ncbi:acyltransferase family protein [Luedemannella helvata]|uniref:SGNH hydrolase domain-containing protein n=1 Tax=Luedemannella helvata TaxID=349315 RepID=A0ABN2K9M8_9ACTN
MSRGFRPDIEGLRGLAVAAVLLWHAGESLVPGGYVGVDVFFVISGFLITGLLVAELDSTGRIDLLAFYARRSRRLLPAAGVVLLATLVLGWLCLPATRWSGTAGDVIAAAAYVVNWRLADHAGDYLAQDEAPSILQHYWSLAVEEQFYLIWPVLLVLVGVLAARRRRSPARWLGLRSGHARPAARTPRGWLVAALAAVGLPSLLWSAHLTTAMPERAYFVTTTRLWELAVGGALALGVAWLPRLPRRLAAVIGWAGLAAIGAALVGFDHETPFPGWAAAVPVLGAAMVIGAGPAAGRAGPERLLDTGVLRALGLISYSLYLWHWPLLVAARARFGDLSALGGLAVVAMSVVPAALTYRFVENPLRNRRHLVRVPARALRLGALSTGVPVLVAVVLLTTVPSGTGPVPGATPGAAALRPFPRDDPAGAPTDRVAVVFPDPVAAARDVPASYARSCHAGTTGTLLTCEFGDPAGRVTVAVAGDSHVAQWLPAIEPIAQELGWRAHMYTKSSCPVLDAEIVKPSAQQVASCAEWNRELRRLLLGPARPDVLITSSARYRVRRADGAASGADDDVIVDALRRTWQAFVDAGVRVVVLRDTPYPEQHIPDCAAAHRTQLTRCSFPRSAALKGTGEAQEAAAREMRGVTLVDLNDAICPTPRCAAVIGGVLIYRDKSHLTASYAASLRPRLRTALVDALGDGPAGP